MRPAMVNPLGTVRASPLMVMAMVPAAGAESAFWSLIRLASYHKVASPAVGGMVYDAPHCGRRFGHFRHPPTGM